MKQLTKSLSVVIGMALLVPGSRVAFSESHMVELAPASDIIDLDVMSSDKSDVGEIEFLMIDGLSGDVRFALIEGEDELELEDDRLFAVPFSALDFSAADDKEVTASVSIERIRNSVRIKEDDVSSLTEPTTVTEVYDFYGTPRPLESDKSTARRDSNTDTGPNTTGKQADAGPNSDVSMDEPAGHHVLVGEGMVSVVIPGLRSADKMLGAAVKTYGNEEIGDIDEIVIDLQSGSVAYVLLTHGGFLGIGDERFALPLEKLTWNPDKEYFTTQLTAESLQKHRDLSKSELPREVEQSKLDDFYHSFGVQRRAGKGVDQGTAEKMDTDKMDRRSGAMDEKTYPQSD